MPDGVEAAPETTAPAPKRAAAARNESASTSAAKGQTARSARAASTAAARSRAAEARKAAASARQRVAASVTTDTTEAEPRPRRATGPIEPIVAESEDAESRSEPSAAEPSEAAAEVTRTWHPGGPDEPPAASDDGDSTRANADEPDATGEAASTATGVEDRTDLTADAILFVGDDTISTPTTDVETTDASVETVDASVETVDADLETADADLETADAAVEPPAEVVDAAEATGTTGAESPVDDDHHGEQGVAVIPLGVVATAASPAARKKRTIRVAREAPAPEAPTVLAIDGLVKRFGDTTAVDAISLGIRAGSFYGIVGPNGAGKTTTLSMITGLLRPDGGSVHVNGIDVWKEPRAAKRITGVLPDRLRLFDRLTGAEMLYYAGSLRGLDHRTVLDRSADLADAFGLEDALDRLVADYSAGMTKKIALACAMIHSPRVLVLDEPFESVDPVSAANLTDILERYVAGGGTVLLSSHSMDLIERVCDSAAIIVGGRVLASGTLDEVRRGDTLEERFVELAGGRKAAEGMEWLHSFSD
ncbi:ATP-binding cassette domain-containing protein [Agromyces sp. GXQ0307]|uniref:ATP-binding cassette domain-containing protein n=1 Tax=Agromyces sp. GXQ0307 TaxID=3377835 RepID=UPI00383B542C